MKLTKGKISNIFFIILIGLLLYPPTKVYFIRLISFSPSTIEVTNQKKITSYNWQLLGYTATDLNFNDTKGEVVLLNFWATWCPPCIAELPSMQKLYNDYKDKVRFVFVTNEDKATIEAFLAEKGYDLPIYTSVTVIPEDLTTTSIPISYVLDKAGNIVIEKTGAADWNSTKVRGLFDELIKK